MFSPHTHQPAVWLGAEHYFKNVTSSIKTMWIRFPEAGNPSVERPLQSEMSCSSGWRASVLYYGVLFLSSDRKWRRRQADYISSLMEELLKHLPEEAGGSRRALLWLLLQDPHHARMKMRQVGRWDLSGRPPHTHGSLSASWINARVTVNNEPVRYAWIWE